LISILLLHPEGQVHPHFDTHRPSIRDHLSEIRHPSLKVHGAQEAKLKVVLTISGEPAKVFVD
jgi:hypothetical protein